MNTQVLLPTTQNVAKCAALIKRGGIVAFPTETVYGLGADAFNEDAVRAIFSAKGRPSDNPLIVHVCSTEQIGRVAFVPPEAKRLIETFMPGPLTLVLPKKPHVPDCVTAGLPTVGVRMPSHPVCRAFLRACSHPICAPSANLSTRPSATTASHVLHDFDGAFPYILDGGACEVGLESTILDASGKGFRLLRAGGVPLDAIEAVAGRVERGVVSDVPLCPGMKYRHYAPDARVYPVEYSPAMHEKILCKYDDEVALGRKVLILCLSGNAPHYGTRNVRDMGKDSDAYAHSLFAALRDADRDGYDAVLCEGVPPFGVGAALLNRLIKSGGGTLL